MTRPRSFHALGYLLANSCRSAVESNSIPRTIALFFVCALAAIAPRDLPAQDQQEPQPTPPTAWDWLKQGHPYLNIRYRFETFEQDGAPFTASAYAPTLRIALGYQTPSFHGFSTFAQLEAVEITGPADYNDPTLPSQFRPGRPIILDPKSLQLSQGYVSWNHSIDHKKLELRVGRQELTLNDGRFLNVSLWRQVHGSFDSVKFDADLPHDFSFTYAFINRFNRETGYNATDGQPPMHTHMVELAWTKPQKARVSLYSLLLDYRSPAQFSLSTQTYGLRVNGPYRVHTDWSLVYTAEFAKQTNYAANPHRVHANYYLGELGPGWRGLELKFGYALLGGRSSTDELTTPLAPPHNGFTDLFFNNPSIPAGSGLEARYVSLIGTVPRLSSTLVTLIYYDYHSDFPRIHYGSEFDLQLAHRFKRTGDRLEVGWRFGRYWADKLFSNALRTSVYTSFTL